jgi:hypothetical protein
MKDFYMRFFRAQANQKYHNPKTGLQTYFLSLARGPPGADDPAGPERTGPSRASVRIHPHAFQVVRARRWTR